MRCSFTESQTFMVGLLEQEKVLEVDTVEPDILSVDNQECVYAMVRWLDAFHSGRGLERSKIRQNF